MYAQSLSYLSAHTSDGISTVPYKTKLSWRLLAAPHFTVVLTVGCCWGQKAKSLAQLSIREINMSLSRVCLHFLIQDIIRAALHMSILFQNCFTIRKTIHYSICIAM